MNEKEINDLFIRIRNEKVKNLKNRKRKASNTGKIYGTDTSVSGTIERKKFRTNEDETDEVQIISSDSHDTQISGDETNEVKIVSSDSNDIHTSGNDKDNEKIISSDRNRDSNENDDSNELVED